MKQADGEEDDGEEDDAEQDDVEKDDTEKDDPVGINATDPSGVPREKTTDKGAPGERVNTLVIVDLSGVHRLPVEPCRCLRNALPLEDQLLAMRLFPASFKRIKTVFTFRLLSDYRIDNLECKTSPYHYYAKLWRLTSPVLPQSVPVRGWAGNTIKLIG